jgi:hypothetical protein
MAAAGADHRQEASGIELCAVRIAPGSARSGKTGAMKRKFLDEHWAAELIGPVSREV